MGSCPRSDLWSSPSLRPAATARAWNLAADIAATSFLARSLRYRSASTACLESDVALWVLHGLRRLLALTQHVDAFNVPLSADRYDHSRAWTASLAQL